MSERDEARAHARIEAELAKLGAEQEPPVGWQARVLAAVAEPPRRRWWWLALPAAAAAFAILLWVIARAPGHPEVELVVAIERTGGAMRSAAEAQTGDVVSATARGAGRRAVWIYRDGRELVLACPGAPGCSSEEGALTATVALALPGSYAIVALTSDAPIPAPAATLDASVAAAETAGARYRTETVTVR